MLLTESVVQQIQKHYNISTTNSLSVKNYEFN